jgi:hypothetical protein
MCPGPLADAQNRARLGLDRHFGWQWPVSACRLNVISAKLQESGKIYKNYFDDQGDDS